MKTFARMTWRTFVVLFLTISTAAVAGGFTLLKDVELRLFQITLNQ